MNESNAKPTHQGYRALRVLFPKLGVLYVVLALAFTAAPGFEVFPIFCWFLFPIVPGEEPRYELVVEKLDHKALSSPTDIQKLRVFEDPMAMDLWLATQTLGAALQRGQTHPASRRTIETNFLCRGSRYRIDRVRFHPLQRYQTGKVQTREALGVFDSQGCHKSPWAHGK